MASVTIRPASPADAPAISSIHYKALARYHAFYGAFFALHPRDILAQSVPAALQKPENEFLVAADRASGAVVGFVRFAVEAEKEAEREAERKAEKEPVAAVDAEEKKEEKKEEAEAGPSLFAVKEHVKDLWEEFNQKQVEIDACYDKAADGRKHIYVNHLMIDPAHQRRGIGGQLLGAVLQRSDAEGMPTFLVSSAESRGLYGRMGFASLGTWRIDNEAWARRIAETERGLGIAGGEGLEEAFRGVGEVEDVMVRWAGVS